MSRFTTRQLAAAGLIAALYAVMSYFSGIFGIAFGPVQCRFSEALCLLPWLMPEAVPGLFVGCLIANLLSPYGALDILFGSLATLLAALWTARVGRRALAAVPPVVCNGLMVGALVTFYEVGFSPAFPAVFAYNAATIALGEALACGVRGSLVLKLAIQLKK